MAKDTFRIPLHLEAPTMRELSSKCLRNNRLNDKMFEYQILKDGDNFLAIFHANLESYIPLEDPRKQIVKTNPGDR